MTNTDFEIYLYLSKKKFAIFVTGENNNHIYQKELIIDNFSNNLDFVELDIFFRENIFKIEKILKKFVNNIYVILDDEKLNSFDISIKKKNSGDFIESKSINYALNEARDDCNNTLKGNKIIHIIIDSFYLDGKKYLKIPNNVYCKYFSLDIKFICLPKEYWQNIKNIIGRYHVSINRLLSMQYLKFLFADENLDLTQMAKKTMDGYNLNEVVLTSKRSKNMTFFEKFFHFFD